MTFHACPSELDEHLFRRESGRIVAALVHLFGVHNLMLAEDVAQDAFCRALEVWRTRGIPDNPSAWLMQTARNRALDLLRRERTARTFAPEVERMLEGDRDDDAIVDAAFGSDIIRDEQLRMMFTCCHPTLTEEAQVALILNILCGFGAPEIASAFLSGRAAVEKRITRGKKALAGARHLFDLTSADFDRRLDAVRRALYLLFSEGYHSASSKGVIHAELCAEAIRLVTLLREYPPAATPVTDALAALMYLHAVRLPARIDSAGRLSALADQDRSRWDGRLLGEGLALLERSAAGTELTAYHVEAAIAAAHASVRSVADTDWRLIVSMYDRLMELSPSPVVALNRAIALAESEGAERGLEALYGIEDSHHLAAYPFYHAALGDLEGRLGRHERARAHLESALERARNDGERHFLRVRLSIIDGTLDISPQANTLRAQAHAADANVGRRIRRGLSRRLSLAALDVGR